MDVFNKKDDESNVFGTSIPIAYSKLVKDERENLRETDIFVNYRKIGSLKFITRFTWVEPDHAINPNINEYCHLQVIIKQAILLEDTRRIGKQNLFVEFDYNDNIIKTNVEE